MIVVNMHMTAYGFYYYIYIPFYIIYYSYIFYIMLSFFVLIYLLFRSVLYNLS